nr:reverse transcriptase domain-containing protein [Tanacetum cinerariifolium]
LKRLHNTLNVMKMTLEKTIEDGLGPCYKKLATLEKGVSKMIRMLMEEKKEDDMGACIEKLDKVRWAAQDLMYDTVLFLFGQSADYRKLWLHLKPESCGNWVKSVGTYENSLIYKEKTKRLYDSKIKDRVFNIGDRVLLFNSRLKIFSGKLKTHWSGPFIITHVFLYGTFELSQTDEPNFKVNGHRLKHYFGEDISKMVVPDLQTFPKD